VILRKRLLLPVPTAGSRQLLFKVKSLSAMDPTHSRISNPILHANMGKRRFHRKPRRRSRSRKPLQKDPASRRRLAKILVKITIVSTGRARKCSHAISWRKSTAVTAPGVTANLTKRLFALQTRVPSVAKSRRATIGFQKGNLVMF